MKLAILSFHFVRSRLAAVCKSWKTHDGNMQTLVDDAFDATLATGEGASPAASLYPLVWYPHRILSPPAGPLYDTLCRTFCESPAPSHLSPPAIFSAEASHKQT